MRRDLGPAPGWLRLPGKGIDSPGAVPMPSRQLDQLVEHPRLPNPSRASISECFLLRHSLPLCLRQLHRNGHSSTPPPTPATPSRGCFLSVNANAGARAAASLVSEAWIDFGGDFSCRYLPPRSLSRLPVARPRTGTADPRVTHPATPLRRQRHPLRRQRDPRSPTWFCLRRASARFTSVPRCPRRWLRSRL